MRLLLIGADELEAELKARDNERNTFSLEDEDDANTIDAASSARMRQIPDEIAGGIRDFVHKISDLEGAEVNVPSDALDTVDIDHSKLLNTLRNALGLIQDGTRQQDTDDDDADEDDDDGEDDHCLRRDYYYYYCCCY